MKVAGLVAHVLLEAAGLSSWIMAFLAPMSKQASHLEKGSHLQ